MSTFEFLFALFGLLLGFSLAEIAGGFSRAYDRRKVQPIGWLAPGLAALLILDILAFWYDSWNQRDIQLKFWVVLVAALVGLTYYFASTRLFPRDGSDLSPTAHIMAHRGEVAAAVIVANLIMYMPHHIQVFLHKGQIGGSFVLTLVYLALVFLVAFARPVWLVGAAIYTAFVMMLVTPLAFNY